MGRPTYLFWEKLKNLASHIYQKCGDATNTRLCLDKGTPQTTALIEF